MLNTISGYKREFDIAVSSNGWEYVMHVGILAFSVERTGGLYADVDSINAVLVDRTTVITFDEEFLIDATKAELNAARNR